MKRLPKAFTTKDTKLTQLNLEHHGEHGEDRSLNCIERIWRVSVAAALPPGGRRPPIDRTASRMKARVNL
jgi:hypothetical protein